MGPGRIAGRAAITALLLYAAAPAGAANGPADTGARHAPTAARTMAPADLDCARDDLTSYTGLVTEMETGQDATRVVIRTDWDTVETIEVPHRGPTGPAWRYRVWNEALGPSAGFLPEAGIRATAWICLDGETPPVIDWRPGERGPRNR